MEHSEDDNNDSQKPLDERSDSQGHPASDTTDDEQEDLPYDGILECYLVPSLRQDEDNKPSTPPISNEEPQPANSPIQSSTIPSTTNDHALYSLESSDTFSLSETISKPMTRTPEDTEQEYQEFLTIPTIIPDVLLRHIAKDNLVNPSEFIHYETMPEISIMESFEETAGGQSEAQPNPCPYSEEEREDFKEEYLEMYREAGDGIQENVTNGSDSNIEESLGNDEEVNESELIEENVEEDEEEENESELIEENAEEDEEEENESELIEENVEEDEEEENESELIEENAEEDEEEENESELIEENAEEDEEEENESELIEENVEEDEEEENESELIEENAEEDEEEENESELIEENVEEDEEEENESELIEENVEEDEEEERFPPYDVDKESQPPTYEPLRRPSYEMKYGQGQVHYRLPDFSKVAPKVKIPKGDGGAAKPSPTKPSPTVKKNATSTDLIGQSFLIQDILDSMQPGPIKEDSLFLDKQREQVIAGSDFQTRVRAESPTSPTCSPSSPAQFFAHVAKKQSDVLTLALRDNGLKISGSQEAVTEEPENVENTRGPTEGEKMTGLLKEQARTLKDKVESFSAILFKKSLPRKEERSVFQNLKSCLETLEIDYLSTKEKHRNLQLQIYRTGSQTVGDFDVEREVEGQVFRLGMLLEDIQEQINNREENKNEPASTPPSGEVLFNTQENKNVHDLVTNNNIDKVESWSSHSTTVSETQVQEDSPVEKEETDILHPLCLYPETSTGTRERRPDPSLSDRSSVNSGNHPARAESSVISNHRVPLILGDPVCKPKGPNSLSQAECPDDWILAEQSGFVEERQSTRKLKKDIGKCSPHLRYPEDEMRKTQKKFRTPKQMAIVVHEKDVDLDSGNGNGMQDSLSSEWSVASHSGLFRCSSNSPISDRTDLYGASSDALWKKHPNGRLPRAEKQRSSLNPDTDLKEHPKEKSLWPSKLPLCVQTQRRQHHKHSSHYVPSGRSSGRSSVSYHSQLTNSTTSTLQRKGWKIVNPSSLDYIDNKILNFVLDNALRTAKNMQKTSERMVQKLATDLVHRSTSTM